MTMLISFTPTKTSKVTLAKASRLFKVCTKQAGQWKQLLEIVISRGCQMSLSLTEKQTLSNKGSSLRLSWEFQTERRVLLKNT